MDFLYDFVKRYWYYFIIGLLSLLLTGITAYLFLEKNKEIETQCEEVAYVEREEVSEKIYVDVKGAVKTPGVYEMDSTNIINDVINKAGGFTKKAYTNNINLSKMIANEMVIYVYTKSEYQKLNEKELVTTTVCPSTTYNIDSCIENGNSVVLPNESDKEEKNDKDVSEGSDMTENVNTKISINTATKDELMKLDGIGESKAENIIKYRDENSGFKTIEEIKNVSGIGDAAYEKIKDSITI